MIHNQYMNNNNPNNNPNNNEFNLKITKKLIYNSILQAIDAKYFSNLILYMTILSYIFKFYNVFYAMFPLLIVNSVLVLYIIIFKWIISTYNGFNKIYKLEFNEDLNYEYYKLALKNNPIKNHFYKIIIYLIHIIPILYFIKKPIVTEFWKYKNVSNITLILFTVIISCFYMFYINEKYKMYGNINENKILIFGFIIYFIVVNILFY